MLLGKQYFYYPTLLKYFNTVIKLGLKEYCQYSPSGHGEDTSVISLVDNAKTLFSAKIKPLKLLNAISIQTSIFSKAGSNFTETWLVEFWQ